MANPYFITQLTDNIPDVIHDLGLIRPIDDPKNKSNFLFLAVQWAQMLLFETWTDHPNAAAVTNQKFAHPDREHKKKAIIFVVNGPDRFEPNELTYLGFNNDASEVPMFEADTINFNQNFGSNPIQSPNGILTFTTSADTNLFGYNATPPCYECKTDAVVTGTLAFPEKGWVKLTVAPGSATTTNNCIAWVKVNSPEMTPLSRNRIYARGSKIYRLRYHDYQLEYFDTTANNAAAGNTWTPIGTNTPGSAVSLINSPWGFTLCADEDKIYVTFRDYDSGSGTYLPYLLYFIDADGAGNRTWIKINSTNFPPDLTSSSFSGLGVYADGGKIYHIGYMSSQLYCFDTAAGNNTWTTIISDTAKETISYGNYGSWTAICVSNGKIYALDGWPGHLVYLNPTASNNVWTNIGTNTTGSDNNVAGSTRDLCVNNGKIYTMASVSGQLMYFIDADGAGNRTWTRIGVNTAGSLMADIPPVYNGQRTWCLTISGNKIYAIANDYDQLVCLDTVTPVPFTTAVPASITVAGIARDITERTDVYIQPSQITANEISLNMTNIRLISAEITNRPCTITTPTCSMSGTTDAIGITEAVAYIDTNVVAPISIDIEQDSASVTFSNVIGYTTPFDVSGTTTISSNQTITISPDTHKYVKQDDGNYRITLTLTNVKISNPQMVNTDTIFEYASIDLPEPSRIVDFSQNVSEKPAFIGAIAYGESATSLGNAGAEYNGGVGYWTAGESTGRPGISGFNRTFHGNIDGDFYLLVEHISGPVPSMNLFCGASSDADNTYNFSGLHRRFLPFDEISPSDYVDF
jgi:hypothetical protein